MANVTSKVATPTCEKCKYAFPRSANHCPHCAYPLRFPNVRDAEDGDETKAVQARYRKALKDLRSRGVGTIGQELEKAVAERSQAVIGRPLYEAERLATSDHQGYASFYELVEAEVRLPEGNEWDVWRCTADTFFFPNYGKHIRFAALTLNGCGLPHYGDVFLVLKDAMIAHRTTVFESNTTEFAIQQKLTIANAPGKIRGRRALWASRGRLAVAKHGGELTELTTSDQLAKLVLRSGPSGGRDDVFLEAHIYGSITIRTCERVVVQRAKVPSEATRQALRERLTKFGVPLEEV